jgi:hypothetical protein
MFCRSLFVLLYFFFWPLCCLFFDIRILITPLVFWNSSYQNLSPGFFSVFMLFYLFVVQYVTLTLFCLSVMVSTVPADLQNILIGTATRRNDQEWTNIKLNEPCEPHDLSCGVCVCCSIDPSFVRLLLFVFMCQNFICWWCPHYTRGPKQFKKTHITYTVWTVDQEGKHIIIIEIIVIFSLYRVNINELKGVYTPLPNAWKGGWGC